MVFIIDLANYPVKRLAPCFINTLMLLILYKQEIKMSEIKKSQNGFALVEGLLILVVVLLIGGTGYYVYKQQSPKNSQAPTQEVAPKETLPTDLKNTLSFEDAEKIATQKVTDDKVANTELHSEGGKLVIKVKFIKGKAVLIDAKTGAVISTDDEGLEKQATAIASSKGVISLSQVKDKIGNKDITSIVLKFENGKLVYVVKLKEGGEIIIDATSSSIIKDESASEQEKSSSKSATHTSTTQDGTKTETQTQSETHNDGTTETQTQTETESHGGSSSNSGSH